MAAETKEEQTYVKYIKHFSTRLIQSLVQARMGGERICHPCSATPGTDDWFSIKIDEVGEIAAYLKQSVKLYPPSVSSFNIDFILYLATGEQMPLETWVITVDKSDRDEEETNVNQFYFSLGQLLKGGIAAARVTPSYRYYVKTQGSDSYVIAYSVYDGEYDLDMLGDERKSIQLGKISSCYGSVSLDLHYRTKMEIILPPCEELGASFTGNEELSTYQGRSVAQMPVNRCVGSKLSPSSPGLPTFEVSQQYESQESQGKLGNSTSSESSATTRQSDKGKSSPQASSSFPLRNSCRRNRLRNNSFPFASLYYDSQYSDDERLPKVEEDADNGNALPELDNSRLLSRSETDAAKAQVSPLTQDYVDEVTENMSIKGSKSSGSLGECKSNAPEASVDEAKKSETETGGEKNDDMESSDDSYVKVFPYGLGQEDLGEDLNVLVQEMRCAPNLNSISEDGPNSLSAQLAAFKERSAGFDQFIAKLKDSQDE